MGQPAPERRADGQSTYTDAVLIPSAAPRRAAGKMLVVMYMPVANCIRSDTLKHAGGKKGPEVEGRAQGPTQP